MVEIDSVRKVGAHPSNSNPGPGNMMMKGFKVRLAQRLYQIFCTDRSFLSHSVRTYCHTAKVRAEKKML